MFFLNFNALLDYNVKVEQKKLSIMCSSSDHKVFDGHQFNSNQNIDQQQESVTSNV